MTVGLGVPLATLFVGHMGTPGPQRERTESALLAPHSELSPPSPVLSPARSYTGSLWQEGTGWIPLPSPGLDLQAIELVAESNHYCHAQKGPASHLEPKKERARRQLYVASAICLVFMIGEIVGKDFCAN